MADELAGRLDAQLKGIEIHRREPGRGQFREKRIIERDDGNIFRNGKPVRQTGAPERHAQQIVADDDGGRPVRAAEQRVHGRVVADQRRHFHAVILRKGEIRQCQRRLIAAPAVGGEKIGVVAAQIGDAPMPPADEIFGRLLPGEKVVVVDVDRLVRVGIGLADEHVHQLRLHQIVDDGIALTGIEQNKRICRAGGDEQPNRREDFVVVAPGDDGADVLMRIAELVDAADHLQIEGVFVNLSGARRQDDADGARRGGLRRVAAHGIAELLGGLTDAPLGVLADGGTVLAGSGYGGWRNACQRRHIPNGYGHRNAPLRRR